MARSILALPVSVEQVAAVIKQMSPADQQQLLNLVPELRQAAMQAPSRTVEEARAAIGRVRAEMVQALGDQPPLASLHKRRSLQMSHVSS